MSAAPLALLGIALMVVYLVGLVWLDPGLAGDAAVMGTTFAIGLGALGVVDLFERRRRGHRW